MGVMMNIIFFILLFSVFGKILKFAFKAAWGISSILGVIIFLPMVLSAMALTGMLIIALPILIVIGMLAFIFC